MNFKEQLKIYLETAIYPQGTELTNRLCALETPQFRQEQSQSFAFMASQSSFISQNACQCVVNSIRS